MTPGCDSRPVPARQGGRGSSLRQGRAPGEAGGGRAPLLVVPGESPRRPPRLRVPGRDSTSFIWF